MWLLPARKGVLPFLQTSRGPRGSRLPYWAARLKSQRLIVSITEVHADIRAAVKDAASAFCIKGDVVLGVNAERIQVLGQSVTRAAVVWRTGSASAGPCLHPSPTACWLCSLGQVTSPPRTSVSSVRKERSKAPPPPPVNYLEGLMSKNVGCEALTHTEPDVEYAP